MGYSVKERAEFFGTFRWIEIQLMEMLARWVPTTPEMEIKVLFGRHVWDCAQHADYFGKRAFELRAPLHYSLPAVPEFAKLLADIAQLESTNDKLDAFYGVACPAIVRQYQLYVERTDPLMDEPSVRILENALRDYERMNAECTRLAGNHAPRSAGHLSNLLARTDALTSIVVHGVDGRRARAPSA